MRQRRRRLRFGCDGSVCAAARGQESFDDGGGGGDGSVGRRRQPPAAVGLAPVVAQVHDQLGEGSAVPEAPARTTAPPAACLPREAAARLVALQREQRVS